MNSLRKILLRGPNWVGDAVLAIPALKAIRKHYPQADITLLVRPWVAGIFTSAEFVDHVWREPRPEGVSDWLRLVRSIRSRQFDAAVLFPNSFESAAMVFLGRVPQRVGYATDGRRLLLTTTAKPSREQRHLVHYYLEIAGLLCGTPAPADMELQASAEEQMQARRLLASAGINGSFIVLNPGAAYGSAKRWGEDRFAEVGDTLGSTLRLPIVLIGSEKERSIAETIRDRMQQPAMVLSGRTSLETLLGVISQATVVVTNDSGPMHIAAAMGIPTVAVFGATNDAVTGPYGLRTRVVKEPVDCAPCMLRECPIDHRCMTRVTAEAVCRAAYEVLNG